MKDKDVFIPIMLLITLTIYTLGIFGAGVILGGNISTERKTTEMVLQTEDSEIATLWWTINRERETNGCRKLMYSEELTYSADAITRDKTLSEIGIARVIIEGESFYFIKTK